MNHRPPHCFDCGRRHWNGSCLTETNLPPEVALKSRIWWKFLDKLQRWTNGQ